MARETISGYIARLRKRNDPVPTDDNTVGCLPGFRAFALRNHVTRAIKLAKLPAVKPRQVVRFWRKTGLFRIPLRGRHQIFDHPSSRRRAVIPSHNRDLPNGTLMSWLREAGFAREERVDFSAGR